MKVGDKVRCITDFTFPPLTSNQLYVILEIYESDVFGYSYVIRDDDNNCNRVPSWLFTKNITNEEYCRRNGVL